MGSRKWPAATTRISVTSISPMMAKGIILPARSCQGLMGVTTSCSMVPISRSRVMARLVRSMVITSRIMASTPGTMYQLDLSSGLYR